MCIFISLIGNQVGYDDFGFNVENKHFKTTDGIPLKERMHQKQRNKL